MAKKFSFEKLNRVSLIPYFLLYKGNLYLFEGVDIPGVAMVATSSTNQGWKWSKTTYTVQIPSPVYPVLSSDVINRLTLEEVYNALIGKISYEYGQEVLKSGRSREYPEVVPLLKEYEEALAAAKAEGERNRTENSRLEKIAWATRWSDAPQEEKDRTWNASTDFVRDKGRRRGKDTGHELFVSFETNQELDRLANACHSVEDRLWREDQARYRAQLASEFPIEKFVEFIRQHFPERLPAWEEYARQRAMLDE